MNSNLGKIEINGVNVGFKYIPKVAGTSVKLMMLEAAGIDWSNSPAIVWDMDWKTRKKHPLNRKQAAFWKQATNQRPADVMFTIVRDPVKRFISGYTNRVLFYQKNNNMSFQQFVDIAPNWGTNSDIRRHMRTMTSIIGKDPGIYDHVFSIDQVDTKVRQFLKEISGREISITRRQTGGNHHQKDIVLTPEQKEKIQNIYADDYKYWWNPQVLPHVFKDNDQ